MVTMSNQALYEVPLSATSMGAESPFMQDGPQNWSYEHSQDWNVASPIDTSNNTAVSSHEQVPKFPSMVSYGVYDPSSDNQDPRGMSYSMDDNGHNFMTPFDTEGLPFAGLEFLQTYNPNATDVGSMDLWNSLGPSAFEYGPEVPFALSDSRNGYNE